MANEMTLIDDALQHINQTSVNIDSLTAGSKERETEAKIYDTQMRFISDYNKDILDHDFEIEKLEFEKEKLEFEKQRSKKSTIIEGIKIGVSVISTGVFAGMGWLKMRENMQQGREIGADAEPWWRELLKK